jgi:cobyrinic acid a,c-diamide synthase
MSAELAVVEGTLDEPVGALSYGSCDIPGDLKPIAAALDLPIVAVVSCRTADDESIHLPRLPEDADAVLLDELSTASALPRLKRMIHLAADLPVIGAVDVSPSVRAALEHAPRDRPLPEELIDALAAGFHKHVDLEAIAELARGRSFPEPLDLPCMPDQERCRHGFRVAYAQDAAFGRYFPDALEALEALGAELVEFSPLRDEALPENVDLVMIGCGMPDQHAEELASNLSMIAALRAHVCRGRRIYSEGGGTAYLGRSMILSGRRLPGAGIFPFDAELLDVPEPPTPVKRTLLQDSWLGPRGTVVRGYRSGRWRLLASLEQFECPACFGALCPEGDWFYHHHAVGSLLHLHFGALPEVVAAFAGPHPPSLRRPSAHGLVDFEPDHAAEYDD